MIIIFSCSILLKLYALSIYLICEYYQIIVFICFINLFDKWIVSIYYSYMHCQLYIWIQFFMEILSITYARVLYLVPFKIPKLYNFPHSRCMLRQFETRSSTRPEGHMRRFLYKNIKFHIEKQIFYSHAARRPYASL